MAKYDSPLRTTAITRRPTAMEMVCPSPKLAAGPASIHCTPSALISHHAGLQTSFVRHHGLVPGRVEHQFDIRSRNRRDYLHFVAHVLDQYLAHSAARRRQGHLDVDRAGRIFVLADIAFVNQPQVDDIDRNFRVIASLELLPHDVLDVFFRSARRHLGRRCRGLADGVRILAGDAEQVAVDIHGEASAQRLGDVAHRAQLEIDFDARGNGYGLDFALDDDRFIFVRHRSATHSVVTAGKACGSDDRKAEARVCQHRLAHFTRAGYSRTPDSAASLPSSSAGGAASSVRSSCTRSNSRSASARVLPFTASVIREAEAVDIAHPWPSKRISLILSSSIFKRTVSRSPHIGLNPSTLASADSNAPKLRGRRLWSRITSR